MGPDVSFLGRLSVVVVVFFRLVVSGPGLEAGMNGMIYSFLNERCVFSLDIVCFGQSGEVLR